MPKGQPGGISSWVSKEIWVERILTFDPSWYLVCMGTGIIVQLLASNFPYPAQWLHTLGYCFWILDICLFSVFTVLSFARTIMFPKVARSMLDDLQQTCYLGTVPIAWETIGTGLVIFYSHHEPAVYVAQVFFWIAVVMTFVVTCGGIYAIYRLQGQHELSDVSGAWLLLFIPMIVAAAFGSNLANAVSLENSGVVLIVSYLMLSLGIGISFLFLGIYIWRLIACELPARALIVSTLVPVGPPSMAAYAFVNLSVALAQNVTKRGFTFRQSWEPAVDAAARAAVAEMIMWVGVIGALFLLGVASFFLVESMAAIATRIPKSFNIGLWSFVFPCGVYSNAFCRLSTLLRNEGMKGWAVACVMVTILLWLMCAILTTYKAVGQGRLFFAPGLQGWVEQKELSKLSEQQGLPKEKTLDTVQSSSHENKRGTLTRRHPRNDGTYKPGSEGDGVNLSPA